jgi:hypothetical protein
MPSASDSSSDAASLTSARRYTSSVSWSIATTRSARKSAASGVGDARDGG